MLSPRSPPSDISKISDISARRSARSNLSTLISKSMANVATKTEITIILTKIKEFMVKKKITMKKIKETFSEHDSFKTFCIDASKFRSYL